MPYVDTDFFLALLKPEDWLKKNATALHKKYKGRIWTSSWTIIELLLLAKRYEIDTERLVTDIFEIASVQDIERAYALSVAHIMKKYDLGVFDALHATACQNDFIISSDEIFDKLGLNRIKLEP